MFMNCFVVDIYTMELVRYKCQTKGKQQKSTLDHKGAKECMQNEKPVVLKILENQRL